MPALDLPKPLNAPPLGVIDAIYSRRSIRSYSPVPVGRAAVEALIEAAVQAPTGVREDPWAFAVIQDRDFLRRLSDSALETLRGTKHGLYHPSSAPAGRGDAPESLFYDAGTLIVIYGKPLGPFVAADCWLAAQNLMLAARALGLGSCVIGLAVPSLNSPEWKAELGVPTSYTAHAPIIVGNPAGEGPATSPRVPRVVAWRSGFLL